MPVALRIFLRPDRGLVPGALRVFGSGLGKLLPSLLRLSGFVLDALRTFLGSGYGSLSEAP